MKKFKLVLAVLMLVWYSSLKHLVEVLPKHVSDIFREGFEIEGDLSGKDLAGSVSERRTT